MKKACYLLAAALTALALIGGCLFAFAADSDYVDLTTVTPKSVQVGWGTLHINEGLDGAAIDMSASGGGVKVFEKGFTAHASSSLEFDVSSISGVRAFTAFIGAEHSSNNGYTSNTDIKFLVYADGALLYESGVFSYSTPCEEIFIPLPEQTKILKLVTDDLGSNIGDHSAWGAPRLYVGELALDAVKEAVLSCAHGAYPATVPVQLQAAYKDFTGAPVTPESTVFTTDDPTVATVSSTGLVTPTGKSGRVTVKVTASHKGSSAKGEISLAFLANETDALADYGSFYDLTYVEPSSVNVGWSSLALNCGLDGKALDMANGEGGTTVYAHGFTAHAPSSVDFDISQLPEALIFTSYAGLEHSSGNATAVLASVRFSVYADGVLICESPIMGYNDPALELFAPIPAGTSTLTLKTDDCGGNYGDHSAWGSPRLLTDPNAAKTFRSLEVTAPKTVYLTGSSFEVTAVCRNLGGEIFTPESISYSSSRPEVASVSPQGSVLSHCAGETTVTVTALYGGVTKTASVKVSFMDEIDVRSFELCSPGGKVGLTLLLDDQGRLSYTVNAAGVTALERSYIGIETEECDFSNALVFSGESAPVTVDETYRALSGKRSTVRNYYNEKTLTFSKGDYVFSVVLRAYDDGFAYRYAIARANGGQETLTVLRETGTFRIPQGSKLYAEFISTLTSTFCYETGYSAADTASVPTPYVCMPMTARICSQGALSDTYLLLSEADYFSDIYPGSLLTFPRGSNEGEFGIGRAPLVTANDVVTFRTGAHSPWRFGVTGDLKTLFESDLAEKLNPAPEGDFSWVEPGVTAWMWLSEGYGGQRNESTIRDYVDLAAEMGWKYLILDEGWQPGSKVPGKVYDGYFDYFEDLISYAEAKGVGFIVWVKYCDLDTPEEREILDEWAEMGIKGIKADFFDSEDAPTLEGFRAIYEKCAENGLLLNCHGASKPTGERRTWPNVINREAVNGEEGGGFWLDNGLYWAFARNVVGPVDITPRLYSTGGNTTTAQMAVNIVFESGMPCMASDSEDYRAFSAKSFYKDLPAAWDETLLLEGSVGEYITVARKSGETWYMASMSSGERNTEIDLSFLGSGLWTAHIYEDSTRREVAESEVTVRAGETLSFSTLSKGGYIVRFTKAAPSFDLTGNGTVNILDVTKLLNYLASENANDLFYDLNGDGAVNILDVTALLNYLSEK